MEFTNILGKNNRSANIEYKKETMETGLINIELC